MDFNWSILPDEFAPIKSPPVNYHLAKVPPGKLPPGEFPPIKFPNPNPDPGGNSPGGNLPGESIWPGGTSAGGNLPRGEGGVGIWSEEIHWGGIDQGGTFPDT